MGRGASMSTRLCRHPHSQQRTLLDPFFHERLVLLKERCPRERELLHAATAGRCGCVCKGSTAGAAPRLELRLEAALRTEAAEDDLFERGHDEVEALVDAASAATASKVIVAHVTNPDALPRDEEYPKTNQHPCDRERELSLKRGRSNYLTTVVWCAQLIVQTVCEMIKGGVSARAPPSAGVGAGAGSGRRLPLLEDFLSVGDFTGAVTLLEFQMRAGAEGEGSKLTAATPAQTLAWLAWAAFHKGDYKRALAAYSQLAEGAKPSELEGIAGVSGVGAINLQRACCFYALGEYEAADAAAATAPDSPLKHRLLLHMYYEMGDESKVVAVHGKLSSDVRWVDGGSAWTCPRNVLPSSPPTVPLCACAAEGRLVVPRGVALLPWSLSRQRGRLQAHPRQQPRRRRHQRLHRAVLLPPRLLRRLPRDARRLPPGAPHVPLCIEPQGV